MLLDQTSLGKFVLKGPDAEAALNWIAANDMSKPVGSLVYTQMLNDQGGIECDLTCVRMAETNIILLPLPALKRMILVISVKIYRLG